MALARRLSSDLSLEALDLRFFSAVALASKVRLVDAGSGAAGEASATTNKEADMTVCAMQRARKARRTPRSFDDHLQRDLRRRGRVGALQLGQKRLGSAPWQAGRTHEICKATPGETRRPSLTEQSFQSCAPPAARC